MKALSRRQAANCESATHPRCRCRCGGAFHGTKRGDDTVFFETLPPDDPHKIDTELERVERKYGRHSSRANKLRQLKLPLEPT